MKQDSDRHGYRNGTFVIVKHTDQFETDDVVSFSWRLEDRKGETAYTSHYRHETRKQALTNARLVFDDFLAKGTYGDRFDD